MKLRYDPTGLGLVTLWDAMRQRRVGATLAALAATASTATGSCGLLVGLWCVWYGRQDRALVVLTVIAAVLSCLLVPTAVRLTYRPEPGYEPEPTPEEVER